MITENLKVLNVEADFIDINQIKFNIGMGEIAGIIDDESAQELVAMMKPVSNILAKVMTISYIEFNIKERKKELSRILKENNDDLTHPKVIEVTNIIDQMCNALQKTKKDGREVTSAKIEVYKDCKNTNIHVADNNYKQ